MYYVPGFYEIAVNSLSILKNGDGLHTLGDGVISKISFSNAAVCSLIALLIIALSSCASVPNEQRIDNIPMYGQPELERPASFKKGDEDFIKQASSKFGGDRHIASDAWAHVAENFIDEGNYHYAMRRYNQSWLLDPDNYKAYWGFGRIMLYRHEYDEAFKHFERAKQLIDDPYQEPALLSDVGVAYHNKGNSLKGDQEGQAKYFKLSNENFSKGATLDPSYPNIWAKWADILFFQGKYSEAWEKANKARALKPGIVPDAFLEDLRKEMPEPK
jgi:tetratricopeptide (TPR) repeat protein